MKSTQRSRILLLLACVVWLSSVGYGLSLVWGFENSPGRTGTPPANWPNNSEIERDAKLPTLVLFIHPHCPCSRATIGELAVLMTHSQGLVNAKALFVKPADFGDAWEKTDLWSSASEIPGVSVTADDQGVEARRFGSETSGQIALYSAAGQLLFSGGITGSRGHSGDNDGRTAILSLLATGKSAKTQTAVFGCPLVKETSNKESEEFCDELHGN
ncbi:MAG: hypothetical protein ND895_24895 [Pyrinomonadaceae bacterium]|nr:hypothetical protein [Pyrinomonadaceae bacterium]